MSTGIEIYGPIFFKPAQIIKELDLRDGGSRNRGGHDWLKSKVGDVMCSKLQPKTKQVRRTIYWPFKMLKQAMETGQACLSGSSKSCLGLAFL